MSLLTNCRRILQQLRHDPRTIALMILAPAFLMTILKFVYWEYEQVFQKIALGVLGVFPMMVMFLVTSVATLRERTSGTLERLMAGPISKAEFLGGYALAFGLAGAVQAVVVSTYAVQVLDLQIRGSQLAIIWVAILDALLGLAIGLFVSSLARTEFQAIQFFPVVLLPQLLLAGLLVPRPEMPWLLRDISNVLPLSYAVDAVQHVASGTSGLWADSLIAAGFIVGLLLLGSMTLKRSYR